MPKRNKIICLKVANWMDKNNDVPFTLTELCEYIHINSSQRREVYNCIQSIRNKFVDYYDDLNKRNMLTGNDNYLRWLDAANRFYDAYHISYYAFHRGRKLYFVPTRNDFRIRENEKLRFKVSGLITNLKSNVYTENDPFMNKQPLQLMSNVKLIAEQMNDSPTRECSRCKTDGLGITDIYCKNCGERL